MSDKLPEIIVFAGPNGSGKSTVTKMAAIVEPYINADDIKRAYHCSDLEAAQRAETLMEDYVSENKNFTFETVLSSQRKINILKQAKAQGYFIRGFYILTETPDINVSRVKVRAASGGHDVPEATIRERYDKSLANIPVLMDLCDVLHIYDNTEEPFRIFKKRKAETFFWPNDFWNKEEIETLVGVK